MTALADELAIRQLVSDYADGVNRYDPEAWAATWAPQGVWQLRPDQDIVGPEAILTHWQSVMETLAFAIMVPSSGQVRLDGDSARGRWYMLEVVQEKPGQGRRGGEGAHIVGVYNDRYCKLNGRWLFQRRAYHMLYESPTDPAGVHLPLPPDQLGF